MLRKTVFLIPVFALALLAVSRVGGLAGKIGTGGLAWAQDTADKSTSIKFKGSGMINATEVTPCSHFECFSITGSVTTDIKEAETGTVAGDATLDTCTENKKTKKKCCTFGSTQTYSFSSGDLDATFGGVVCEKAKSTTATVKNAPFEITGGTGSFSAATGSGKGNFTYDTNTGAGKFSFSGKGTE